VDAHIPHHLRRPIQALVAGMLMGVAAICTAAELRIEVQAAPDPVMPGEMIATFITVANVDTQPSDALRIELPFPAGLQSLADNALSDGGDCNDVDIAPARCANGETITWLPDGLAPGDSVTVSLTPAVDLGHSGTIEFIASVSEASQPRASQALSLPVVDERTLGLSIDAHADPVAAGDVLRYTLSFGNRAAHSFAASMLQFSVPPGATFVAASDDGLQVGDDIVWDLSTLTDGNGGRRTVDLQIGAGTPAGTLLVAEAMLSGEANFATDTARDRSVVRVAVPAARLSITALPDPARPGELLPVELSASNPGNDLLDALEIELLLPEGFASRADSAVLDGADCSNVDNAPNHCGDGERLLWPIGPLPPGGAHAVTLPAIVDAASRAPADGALIALDARLRQAGTTAARARHSLRVADPRRLDLALDASHDPAVPGATLGYTLAYGNRSDSDMPQAELRLRLPADTSVVALPAEASQVGDELRWALGTLPAHSGGHREVQVQLDGGPTADAGILRASATLRGVDQFVINEAGAVSHTRLEPAIPLSLQLAASPSNARPGEPLDVTLTVDNTGSTPLFNVTLRLLFPQAFAAQTDSSIGNGADCNNVDVGPNSCGPGETVQWNLGALAAGEQRSVTLPAVLRPASTAPPDGALIRLQAIASSDSFGRAIDHHTVLIAARPDLVFHDSFEGNDAQ